MMLHGKLKKEYRDALISMIDNSKFMGSEADKIIEIKKELLDFEEGADNGNTPNN